MTNLKRENKTINDLSDNTNDADSSPLRSNNQIDSKGSVLILPILQKHFVNLQVNR